MLRDALSIGQCGVAVPGTERLGEPRRGRSQSDLAACSALLLSASQWREEAECPGSRALGFLLLRRGGAQQAGRVAWQSRRLATPAPAACVVCEGRSLLLPCLAPVTP